MKTAVLINRSVTAAAAQVQRRLATLANLAAYTEIHTAAASLASRLKTATIVHPHLHSSRKHQRGQMQGNTKYLSFMPLAPSSR